MSTWHQMTATDVLAMLSSDPARGLTTAEVSERRAQYGANELQERGARSAWRILGEQFTALLVVLLIVAAVVSAALHDIQDAVAILTIVVLNALLGFRQEYRAERAMAALQRLAAPQVHARRDGHLVELPARELVPGDIVQLEAGSAIPADGRLVESANLRLQEAALTGESEPVDKRVDEVFGPDQPLADRRNMVFLGSSVTYGRGWFVVAETGMHTELGRIATMMQQVHREPTPLQRRLDALGRVLAAAALGIVAVIFWVGLARGESLRIMFLTAVSLAVAAVPEGLPAVVTIALALGAQRMLKRNALIRKLPAVETFGSVTVICTDKTGTLTRNEMAVVALHAAGRDWDMRLDAGAPRDPNTDAAATLLLTAAALCNDVVLDHDATSPALSVSHGDPTEIALVQAALRFGINKNQLESLLPRVAERPFDSQRKRMTTVHKLSPDRASGGWLDAVYRPSPTAAPASFLSITKGAVDGLLELSTRVWGESGADDLDDAARAALHAVHNRLAQSGVRVLGVACRWLDELVPGQDVSSQERDLVFVGLIGMVDPPRPEVPAAVATCRTAGIRPVMITGDHPLTAQYIAREIGIEPADEVVLGADLDRWSADEIDRRVDVVNVYARVSPEHKLKLVQGMQRHGAVVAMTGDGVNDAPALKRADIGVSMGVTGTDVAQEASDMVLRDDNFATIVAAVEEGRVIFDNIRKFVRYLLSANCGELWVMFLGPLFRLNLPLLPLQILWMNLVTDGLPALALGVEPPEPNVMRRPPYAPGESVFARGLGWDVLWIGVLLGALSLGVGIAYASVELPPAAGATAGSVWQTMVFSTLTFGQMALALALRSERTLLIRLGLGTNKPLLAAVGSTLVLQLGVIYFPPAQHILHTAALSARDLGVCLLLSAVVFAAVEFKKWCQGARSAA